MRTALIQTFGKPRERRRQHDRRSRRRSPRPAPPAPVTAAAPRCADPAVGRVREAGGPVDRACYACACGYLFHAPVSTTVSCPHCGASQAW